MIDLGLGRIARLLTLLGKPQNRFRAIHVAGTNGKGSICAYIASVLTVSNIKTGRFTSPHLAYVWDCITINGKAVEETDFRDAQARINAIAKSGQLEPTEFEILTATAFELFKQHKVEVAVVEVGLGGRLDATNVLEPENVLVSVISRVGMDHEGFLGNTLEAIAGEKGGIAKSQIPLIVDGFNDLQVKTGVHKVADPLTTVFESGLSSYCKFGKLEPSLSPLKGSYQVENLATAIEALDIVAQKYPQITRDAVIAGIKKTQWPGRLQICDYKPGVTVLVDGAHNPQAAKLLGQFVNEQWRTEAVTFIVGFSGGKNVGEIAQQFIKNGDTVVTTGFSPVEGMPWVRCETHEVMKKEIEPLEVDILEGGDIENALEIAVQKGNPIVVCGSLYLVGDFVRCRK